MIFYGYGIVRLSKGRRAKFTANKVRYEPGTFQTDNVEIMQEMKALGYKSDGEIPVKVVDEEKVELVKMAKELGIDADNRWGIDKLNKAIEEAEIENG